MGKAQGKRPESRIIREERTGPAPAKPARSGREKKEAREAKLPEKAGSEYKAWEGYGLCSAHSSDPPSQDLYYKVAGK